MSSKETALGLASPTSLIALVSKVMISGFSPEVRQAEAVSCVFYLVILLVIIVRLLLFQLLL